MRKLFCFLLFVPLLLGITASSAQVSCQANFTSSAGSNPYIINFSNTSQNFTSVHWSFGDGSSSNVSNPSHTYNGHGWYAVCLTISDSSMGCSSTYCDTLWAGQTACSAMFTYSISGNNQVHFTGNNATATVSWSWSFGDGTGSNLASPVHNYSNPGVYPVCLTITNTNGCTNTYCQNISISNPPQGCSVSYSYTHNGTNAYNFAASSTPANSSVHYTWDFGDGTTGTGSNQTHTFPVAGHYAVCVSSSDPVTGCTAIFCDTITVGVVNPGCHAAFTYQTTAAGVSFHDQSAGNPVSWSWMLPNGNISYQQNPVIQLNPGTYTICLAIQNAAGCADTVCQNVTISNTTPCQSSFNYSTSPANPFAFTFNNTSTGGTHYNWNFGDGTSSNLANPNHIYSQSGTYVVCLSISNPQTQCQSYYCDTLVISSSPNCTAYFTYQQGSANGSVYFSGSSNQNSASYTWSFGDGSSGSGQNPVHTYAAAGTYHVCVTATSNTSGCSNTYCSTITVTGPNTACHANFYFQSSSSGLVYFSNSSIGGNASYFWSFGDGTSSNLANPIHQYAHGTWNVCLTMTTSNGCTSTICKTVSVPGNTNCMASFVAIPDSNGTGVAFSNTSIGTNGPYHWDFGDGNSSTHQNPYHIYASAGTYTVCLSTGSASTNCIDTYCLTITVNSPSTCVPTFYTFPDSSAFGNGIINFLVHSTCTGPITWSWNFGDGTTSASQNPSHQFTGTGWFNVCVTATLPTGSTYTHCDSVYVFRLASGISETESVSILAYPNPSPNGSWISFDLQDSEQVQLQIFDLSGRMISTIAKGVLSPGNHNYHWDATDVPAGMYLVRLQAGYRTGITRLAIIH